MRLSILYVFTEMQNLIFAHNISVKIQKISKKKILLPIIHIDERKVNKSFISKYLAIIKMHFSLHCPTLDDSVNFQLNGGIASRKVCSTKHHKLFLNDKTTTIRPVVPTCILVY